MNLIKLLCGTALLLSAACTQTPSDGGATRYVAPKIGTGGHGHVFLTSSPEKYQFYN